MELAIRNREAIGGLGSANSQGRQDEFYTSIFTDPPLVPQDRNSIGYEQDEVKTGPSIEITSRECSKGIVKSRYSIQL